MSYPRHVLSAGERFGLLRVLGPGPDRPRSANGWVRPTSRVVCVCGHVFVAFNTNLLNGGTRSCGCTSKRTLVAAMKRRAAAAVALALVATSAGAAPFIFNDAQPGVTHCSFRLDTIPVIDMPLIGGVCRLNVDIPGLTFNTLHSIRFATVSPGPPRVESAPGPVFQFRKIQNADGTVTWQGWTDVSCAGQACAYD